MSIELIITVAAFLGAGAVAGLSLLRAGRPADPLKVRLIDYNYVAIFAVAIMLVVGAHLVTLIAGHPVTGRRFG